MGHSSDKPFVRYSVCFIPHRVGCVLLALVGLAGPVQALDPHRAVTHYNHTVWHTVEGLPQDSVRSIAQTRDGYLWLGTQAGLTRFDGERFTVFDHLNSPLNADHILALCASRDGSLWIGSGDAGGLFRWSAKEGFVSISSGFNVRSIFEDRDGIVWVGGEGKGLLRVSGTDIRVVGASVLGQYYVRTIVQDGSGILWFGTDVGGLFRSDGKELIRYGEKEGFTDPQIWALWPDPDGSLWVGTKGKGLFHLATGKAERFSARHGLSSEVILALTGDRDGNLWIGTDGGGLVRYYAGKFEAYTTSAGLSGDIVRTIFEDREGNLWLGTAGAGLNRLKDDPFNNYSRRDGLSNDLVYSMLEDADGAVWIGTSEGWLNYWKRGRIRRFRLPDTTARNNVVPLIKDNQGNLWAGILSRSEQLPGVQVSGRRRPARLEVGNAGAIRAVVRGPDGTTWLGCERGLLEVRDGAVRRTYADADGLPSNRVLAIAFAPGGEMWVATSAGLAHRTAGRFQAVNGNAELHDTSIQALWFDERGALWIGSRTKGLYRIRDGRLTQYGRSAGLPDNQVFSILEDSTQRLWLTCRKGIYRVSIDDIDHFDARKSALIPTVIYENLDGLRSSEVNYGARPPAMRTRDGRFWFATYGGVAVIDPDHLNINSVPPPVFVEGVTADGVKYRPSNALSVRAGQRNIEIQYTALNFRAPQRVRFRYRLEGFDADWVEAEGRRTAYYTNLPPGSYQFRVLACNSDGVWNNDGATLKMVLRPYFYETWWFWPSLSTLAIACGILAVRSRLRLIRARETELTRRVDERTHDLQSEIQVRRKAEESAAAASRAKSEFLANVSHELRTPMNGVVGMTQLALAMAEEPEQREYLTLAQRSAESLMLLLNDILDLSRIEAGKLSVELVAFDPGSLVNETVRLLQVNADSKGLSVFCDCAADIPGCVIADPLRIRQVLVNLLGNAIKFTEAGSIHVGLELAEERNRLCLTVRDTGIGIPREKQEEVFKAFSQADGSITRRYGGSGLGLTISSKLVRLMGGTMCLESQEGVGTTFTIVVPYEATTELLTSRAPVGPAVLAPMRILLAEDNPVNQKVASRQLQKKGHSVFIVADGRSAVSVSAKETFDLILMDVQMPEMDGLEATAAIRQREAGGSVHIPIIAMTAHAMAGDRDRCLAAGMDGYVRKPIRLEEMLQAVAEVTTGMR